VTRLGEFCLLRFEIRIVLLLTAINCCSDSLMLVVLANVFM